MILLSDWHGCMLRIDLMTALRHADTEMFTFRFSSLGVNRLWKHVAVFRIWHNIVQEEEEETEEEGN